MSAHNMACRNIPLSRNRLSSGIACIRLSRCRNCGGGDRGRVAIYRPFGELRRAKIVLSPVRCSRPTTGVPLAHATMNFVGLDLTASDRWHQTTTTTTTSNPMKILRLSQKMDKPTSSSEVLVEPLHRGLSYIQAKYYSNRSIFHKKRIF
ncbi:hypothetical protein TNCV_884391 [Trichonephila clavipes]|nr:hypothetical protein TNCV_884391 [Trichonephila clavipes]